MPLTMSPQEIHVTVTKDEGAVLGLRLEYNNLGLVVTDVEDHGVLRDWNSQEPARQVRAGDVIVAVNGKGDSVYDMLEGLQKAGTLNMVVSRRTVPGPGDLFGLQFRSLGPEDFDALLALDETVPSRNTASRRAVERLPRCKAGDCGTTECRVCLGELSPDTVVIRLPCRHAFHPECAVRWLTECKRLCPLCAAPVPDYGFPSAAEEKAMQLAAQDVVDEAPQLPATLASRRAPRPASSAQGPGSARTLPAWPTETEDLAVQSWPAMLCRCC